LKTPSDSATTSPGVTGSGWEQTCQHLFPWFPKPGPQSAAFLSQADELFFGGKAGAGKSDLLIGLGLTAHRKSLFLRRQATQLQEVSSRVGEILRPGDRYKHVGHGGLLTTSDGRTIEFTGCDNEKDKQKFKGRAHDAKLWDEVVDFPESVYTFVNGWNRTTVPGLRCRVVCASNPPTTAEGEWVIRRWRAWLDPQAGNRAGPGELRWYTTIGEQEEEFAGPTPVTSGGYTYYPRSRTFIPGDMLDLLVATGYANTLATLPEPLRSIYLRGDFGAAKQDARWQLIPTRWVEQAEARWPARMVAPGPLAALGVDPSMGGQDKAALAPRYGAAEPEKGATIGRLVRKPGKEILKGDDLVPLILAAGGGTAGAPTNVDAIGIGKTVVDSAKLLGLAGITPVVVSNASTWRDVRIPTLKFANLRAAMMWKVRTLLDPEGGPPETRLALPPDSELRADLTAPLYSMTPGGLKVESKEDIFKRIGRSTDAGDAVGLACWKQGGWTLA
jgi:hypothetical protein